MSIVDHNATPEVPWRPNYRNWNIAGPDTGVSVSLTYSTVGEGAGAPLHTHEDDELITVLDGVLEVRIGDEVRTAGPEHTVVVPRGTAHGFTSVASRDARLLVYFPVPNPFERTTYLEGQPAAPFADKGDRS